MTELKKWFYAGKGGILAETTGKSWPRQFTVWNGNWVGYVSEDLKRIQVQDKFHDAEVLWTADELPLEEGSWNEQIEHIKSLISVRK